MIPKAKRKALEEKGWRIGDTADFLDLTVSELAYIDLKIKLAEKMRQVRKDNELTQKELAKTVHSSQSRIAKMESGDPSVSLDLLIQTLLALGVSSRELGKVIS